MAARECLVPRGSRGSGTSAKHPSKSPPLAACRPAARAASSSSAASPADAALRAWQTGQAMEPPGLEIFSNPLS